MCISPLIYSHPRPYSGWTLQWIANVVDATSSPIGVEGGISDGEPRSGGTLRFKNIYMAKWHQFKLFSAPYITKCSYIDAQSHQPVLR